MTGTALPHVDQSACLPEYKGNNTRFTRIYRIKT